MATLDPTDGGQGSPLSFNLLNCPERKKSPFKCPCTPPQWLCLFQSLSFYFYFSPTLMANGPPFVPSSSIICAAGFPRHKISHLTHGWTIWLLHLATNGDLQTAETAGWRTWGMSQMDKFMWINVPPPVLLRSGRWWLNSSFSFGLKRRDGKSCRVQDRKATERLDGAPTECNLYMGCKLLKSSIKSG